MINQAVGNFLFKAVGLCFILNALQAYAVGPVPLTWFANALIVLVFSIFAFNSKFHMVPGLRIFAIFFVWLVLNYFSMTLFKGIPGNLPGKATVGYGSYVGLRFLTFLTFAATVTLIFWLQEKGYSLRIVDFTIQLAVWVGIYSIYVYLAQLNGWPEFPRTRIGTSGEEQAVSFSYAFHRAMGPFREPSHFAEWLLLPLFLSMWRYERILNWRSMLLSACFLLTGSVSGISAFLGGLVFAFLFNMRRDLQYWLQPFKIASAIAVALIAFSLLVGGGKDSGKPVSLVEVLWTRVEPILFDKGLKSSNRDYVYIYAEKNPFTFFGVGLGNANIAFSQDTGATATSSFLSLYLYVLYSCGLIGLLILAIFLLFPVVYFISSQKRFGDHKNIYILAAYIAWLIDFSVHSEELSIHFGLIYSILVGLVYFGTDETKNSYHL